MSDQWALNNSGSLKDAEDIEFFFSESEMTPLGSSTASLKQILATLVSCIIYYFCYFNVVISLSGLRRGQWKKNIEKMYTSIVAEQHNKYGTVIKKHQPHQWGQWSSRPAKKLKIDIAGMDNRSDPDNDNFVSDGSLMGSSKSEDGDTDIDKAPCYSTTSHEDGGRWDWGN